MTTPAYHPEVERRRKATYWYAEANIPAKHRSRNWERIVQTEDNGTALAVARERVAALQDYDELDRRGIALFGPPGTGKTMIACTMLASLIRPTIPTTITGLFEYTPPGYFITLSSYRRLHLEYQELDRWARSEGHVHEDMRVRWERNFLMREHLQSVVEYLVLDDVGHEYTTTTGYAESLFHDLVRGRHERGLVTLMTSNLTYHEFADAYGEPQASFLYEICHPVWTEGVDWRTVKL